MASWRAALGNRWLQLFLLLAVVMLGLQAWQQRGQQALGERIAAAAAPGDLHMGGAGSPSRRWRSPSASSSATPPAAPSSSACRRRARR